MSSVLKVTMKKLLLLIMIFAIALSAVDCELNCVGEWQILTRNDFSSQIRLHPHILLIVTVPWCGESRSLMKEISRFITDRKDDFIPLKLMVMYGNTEKMLANSIGVTEGITVLYYHHSVSYKYQGRLRAQNILYSVQPYMSVLPAEIPLKFLNSEEDLNSFLQSTDKALVLFEFCGWSAKLLAKRKNNRTEHNDISLHGFGVERDGVQISGGDSKEKVTVQGMKDGKLMCEAESGFSGIPLLGQFSSQKDSNQFQGTNNGMNGVGLSCNFTEFQQFDSFFSKFLTLAREFFLPPERHRFALVTERSLLKYFGIEDSDSWLAIIHLIGCPGCSKVVKEVNELESLLQMKNKVIAELDGHGQDIETILPVNKPSIILFVDKSSDSLETRRRGKEALDSFVDLAQQCLIPNQMSWCKSEQSMRPSVQASHASRRLSGHPRLKISSTTQNIKLNSRMSVMVVNKGKHVSLDNLATDLHGSSLQEILTYLLKSKKEAKLSSLASQAGFQLLSDDFDIKITDESPSQTEVASNPVSPAPSEDYLDEGVINPGTHPLSVEGYGENSQNTNVVASHHDRKSEISVDTEEKLISDEPDISSLDHYSIGDDGHVGETSSLRLNESQGPQLHFEGSGMSFFFSDGNYRFLRALTGGSAIPSLAIVDPISQQHYVFPDESILNYSSMVGFLHAFLNGSLLPYQFSESVLQSPKEAPRPPFVNMDFREMDSIPRVTTRTFSKMVLGFQCDSENSPNAWHEDVLVLFSSSWCGFCIRMELVVREVYRAVKGYMEVLKNGYRNGKADLSGDNFKNVISKFPRIYLMDCALNDCTSMLKSMDQKEVYPSLILFPAEKKNAVFYNGDVAVADVIKFIADHGNNSQHLISENGILWALPRKGGKPQSLFKGSSPATTTDNEETPVLKKIPHQVILKSVNNGNHIKSHTSVVVVGSVLIATDKINMYPFENAKILIVKADEGIGFQGVIINKHIRWESLNNLDEGLEFLKQSPLSFGGPLIQRGMPLVVLTRTSVKYPEIQPGVHFLDQKAIVSEIEELRSGNHFIISDYWFFVGYSSWGWDQLFDEIAQGAWTIGDENTTPLDWPLT